MTLNHRMKRDLEKAMVDCVPDDTKKFLPAGDMDRIVTLENVEQEINIAFETSNLPRERVQKLVEYVCGPRNDIMDDTSSNRKIFALLVLLKKLSSLPEVMDEGITDADFPFFKPMDTADAHDPVTMLIRRRKNNSEAKDNVPYTEIPVRFFHNWEHLEVRKFYTRQWELLVPFLAKAEDGSVAMYELDQQAIMPWTLYDEKEVRKGGFATVRQVHIHPDHHAFSADRGHCFALKTVIDAEEKEFEQEFYALRKLETNEEKHLLPLYAALHRGHDYAFLFPWANGGNLADLWTTDPAVPYTSTSQQSPRTFILWLSKQCLGVAKGLRSIHDVRTGAKEKYLEREPKMDPSEARKIADDFGIHGDIKPENILVFKASANKFGGGDLRISDFGLTNFFTKYSRSRQLSEEGPADVVYRAPESDSRTRYMSRKYDIWSLGCVFSQLLTWAIRDTSALDQYETRRLHENDEGKDPRPSWKISKFFKKIYPQNDSNAEPEMVVKESVRSWLEELKDKAGRRNFLADFIDFIKDRMLVVDVGDRADCRELVNFLQEKYEKCRREVNYSSAHLQMFQPRETQSGEADIQMLITDPQGNKIGLDQLN
ncbi:kinase-like protein [Thozetella sp. PMI_491]|nr:kinase-like protein [Thozetella sp. PMI_491]